VSYGKNPVFSNALEKRNPMNLFALTLSASVSVLARSSKIASMPLGHGRKSKATFVIA
jgi:hypothetical protein